MDAPFFHSLFIREQKQIHYNATSDSLQHRYPAWVRQRLQMCPSHNNQPIGTPDREAYFTNASEIKIKIKEYFWKIAVSKNNHHHLRQTLTQRLARWSNVLGKISMCIDRGRHGLINFSFIRNFKQNGQLSKNITPYFQTTDC